MAIYALKKVHIIKSTLPLKFKKSLRKQEQKKQDKRNIFNLPCFVVLPVQFSNLFIMDLQRLANIVA